MPALTYSTNKSSSSESSNKSQRVSYTSQLDQHNTQYQTSSRNPTTPLSSSSRKHDVLVNPKQESDPIRTEYGERPIKREPSELVNLKKLAYLLADSYAGLICGELKKMEELNSSTVERVLEYAYGLDKRLIVAEEKCSKISNEIETLKNSIQSIDSKLTTLIELTRNQISEIPSINRALDGVQDNQFKLSKTLMETYHEHKEQLEDLKNSHNSAIKKMRKSHTLNLDELNWKLENLQNSHSADIQQVNENMEALQQLICEMRFKGNVPQSTKSGKGFFSSLFNKKEKSVQETNPIVENYETISFSIFQCSSGYENTIVQLIDLIRNQCNANQYYLDYNHKTTVNEFKSGDKVLFIRYCGSSRFESSEASLLLEKGCKLVFILLTYGEKTKEITLPTQFQTCSYIQIPISGTNIHSTQDLIGMDEEKQSKLFNILSSNFISLESEQQTK